MAVVLQVLGGLCLLAVALVVLVFFVARAKLRKFGEAIKSAGGMAATPPRIHLLYAPTEEWTHPSVRETVAAFENVGYARGHVYSVQQIDDLIVYPFVSPEQDAYGVAYRLGEDKVWGEFVQIYTDGTGITVSNSTHSQGLREMPGRAKVYLPDAPISDLYRRFLAERPIRETVPATIDAFKEAIETAYAEEMDWRNAEGVSEEEIIAIARNGGDEPTPEVVAATKAQLARQANEQLDVSLRENYLSTTTMSAKEWSQVEDRLVFIHNRLSREELEEWVEGVTEFEDPEFPDGPAREAFAAYNATLPENRRFRHLETVSKPIEADVYVAPEEV